MRRADIIEKLRQVEVPLRALGVGSLYLFGSHARDEAREESDVDVFVDSENRKEFGLRRYFGAYHALQDAVGLKVDYGTREGLHPFLRTSIEEEAIRIF